MSSLRGSIRGDPLEGVYQVAEKWPSAAFPSSLVVAAYSQVRLTPQEFGSPRKAGFRKTQLASACLPKPRRRQGPF